MKKSPIYLLFLLLSTFTGAGQLSHTEADIGLRQLFTQPYSMGRDSVIIEGLIYKAIHGTDSYQGKKILEDSAAAFAAHSAWPGAVAHFHLAAGRLSVAVNEHYQAFDHYEKALEFFKKNGDTASELQVVNRLAGLLVWNLIENEVPDEAKEKYRVFLEESIALARSKKDTGVWGNVEIVMVGFYIYAMNDYKKGLELGQHVKSILRDKDRRVWFDFYYMGDVLIILSQLYSEENAEDRIARLMEVCKTEAENGGDSRFVLTAFGTYVADFYRRKGDWDKAFYYARIAENQKFYANFPYAENLLNNVFYQVYKSRKEYIKAYEYLEKVKTYEDKVEHSRMNKVYSDWQKKYEDEKLISQIKTLENEKLREQNARETLIRHILMTGACVIALFVVLGIRNNKLLKKKNSELKQKNEEILSAFHEGKSTERSRIASDLHDNLNTKIAALKWRVEALNLHNYSEEDRRKLGNFNEALVAIYDDVRQISHNMMSESLSSHGLKASLESFLSNLPHAETVFDWKLEFEDSELSDRLSHEVYSIVLELVSNVMKHARSPKARVSVMSSGKHLKIEVSDQGRGLPQVSLQSGIGLQNIQRRLTFLNGKLTISTEPGKGTDVVVSLPL